MNGVTAFLLPDWMRCADAANGITTIDATVANQCRLREVPYFNTRQVILIQLKC